MTIHQEIGFNSSPQRIFDALTIAEQFGEATGAPAEINPSVGGTFSCFGDMISGVTVEIVPNERLVQAWRVANWEPGVYSIVRFELNTSDDKNTTLVFDHTGYPESDKDHLEQGWHNKYWNPLKKHLDA